MKLAKVVAVHPERHKVDLEFLDDGRRIPGVRVMSGEASSSSGRAALHQPASQSLDDPYGAPSRSSRDLIACVGFYGDIPVVQGFLFPEVSECLFADADRVMNRTPSDLYWTVDSAGNAELFHPSGAYFRIGTDPTHEDLTAKDFDGIFKTTRNTGRQVHFHMELAGGKGSIDMAPNGDVTLTHAGNLSIQTAGTSAIHSDGEMTISSGVKVKIDAPAIEGTGHVTIDNGMTSTGDVTADGISLKTHAHHSGTNALGNTDGPF